MNVMTQQLHTPVKVMIFGHKEFSQLVSSVIPEYSDKAQFKIIDAIVGSAAEIQQHINQFNPEVVVSGGVNASYLNSMLDIPVASLDVTESDIIEAVSRAAQVAPKIVLFNFKRTSAVIPLLESSLGITIQEVLYSRPDEARESFHIVSKQKDIAIVGASLVCGLAAQNNVLSFMFYSPESCRNTLREAIELGKANRASKTESALTNWLLNQSKTPIIMTDTDGDSVTLNEAARRELDLSLDYEIDLAELIHPEDAVRPTDGECQINGNDWWFHQDKVDTQNQPMHVYQLYRKKLDAKPADKSKHRDHKLTFESSSLAQVMTHVKSFSTSPSNVLINGESGTGKELVARAIYEASPYSKGKFVALNCSAIPTELFEGELFGHRDGAFTGSKRGGRKGLIEEAQNGVLFLDEISELAMDQQAKLLRFLQERQYRPLGSNEEKPVVLKLVAASNKSLKSLVDKGLFREDLFFRLNVFNIHIPPLRMRPEDILCIAESKLQMFLETYQLNISVTDILAQITTALTNYSWPGNVRELENVLERIVACLHMDNDLTNLDSGLRQIAPELFVEARLDGEAGLVRSKELELVADAMHKFAGDKQKAAEYLGMSQTTLWRRLKRIHKN